ncbi:MAG TPA: hypothetical protein VNA65_10860 [Candidatus Dormibacteraeota bacterium]|nr:hypothetical protein [Candidatus Dormibacteraeota bacterium]
MRPTLIAAAIAAVVAVAGVFLGAWWLPFLAGAALGAAVTRARWAVPLGAACGLFAWLLPLAVDHVRYGLGSSANALAAIMGFDHAGAIPVVLTLLVGTLLGLTGAWVASGARLLIAPALR